MLSLTFLSKLSPYCKQTLNRSLEPERNTENLIHKAGVAGNSSKHPCLDLLLIQSTELGRKQARKSLICGKGLSQRHTKTKCLSLMTIKRNCTTIYHKKIISSVTKLRYFSTMDTGYCVITKANFLFSTALDAFWKQNVEIRVQGLTFLKPKKNQHCVCVFVYEACPDDSEQPSESC